ncbi:stigma-specific STIG1-like protein 2 [Ananas comosus]|uniref:Stigma-specific STIG1-like protein 2 n=1 Tax=Ananas comosus TaxID=4615 RepID=A0A6P5F4D1_ANACO|nr:stigma-specific STIG1-like protein 2 [Ananas comosus]
MAPRRRPTLSLLLLVVLLLIAVSADATSAESREGETEGYAAVVRDQFMGLKPWSEPRSGSRFLAAVGGKKGDICDGGNVRGCAGGDPGQRLRCCRSRCTDLLSSRANCGACGKRCGFGQLCCKGQCTTIAYDVKNCGGCGVRCQRGLRCTYGLCGYA